ncbi:MAG: LD-carboxypeptidase, partial [Myxococcota bacterium]|nr:LD-carboxypeptidase [Myxococcota bacterium]
MAAPLLQRGARVAVISPSGVHDPVRLAHGVALVESWGLAFSMGPHAEARFRYTAGTVAQRASDLVWALTDPDVDAVWFTRGGFGTAHLLESVPWEHLDGRPVIGFSDATALFAGMWARGRGTAVHAPVLHSLADHVDSRSRAELRAMLLEGGPVHLPGAQVAGPVGRVEGPLVGGNLCVLASLAGTPFAISARGCILLLEEIGERPYKVDRLVTQLHRSGALDGVRGVALGQFIAPRNDA